MTHPSVETNPDKELHNLAIEAGIIPPDLIDDLNPNKIGDVVRSLSMLRYQSKKLGTPVTTEMIAKLTDEALRQVLSEASLEFESLSAAWAEIILKLRNKEHVDSSWMRKVRLKWGCVKKFQDCCINELKFRQHSHNQIRKVFLDLLVDRYSQREIAGIMRQAAAVAG